MKVKELEPILSAIAVAYAHAGATDKAQGVRALLDAVRPVDKEDVSKIVQLILMQAPVTERP
jgi:hypothetical protein